MYSTRQDLEYKNDKVKQYHMGSGAGDRTVRQKEIKTERAENIGQARNSEAVSFLIILREDLVKPSLF